MRVFCQTRVVPVLYWREFELIRRARAALISQMRQRDPIFGMFVLIIGGAEGDRTPDLMTASHALSQLSYGPKGE